MQPAKTNHHSTLASYFTHKPLYLDEPTRKKPNIRKLTELPFQIINASDSKSWEEEFSDPQFASTACEANLTYGFLHDLDIGLNKWRTSSVRIVRIAVASSLRTVLKYPGYSLSVILNRIKWLDNKNSISNDKIDRARKRLDANGPWFETMSDFSGEEGIKYQESSPYQVFIHSKNIIAAADKKGFLEFRDIYHGNRIHSKNLQTHQIKALAVEPKSLLAAWMEKNGEVRSEVSDKVFIGRIREKNIVFPDNEAILAVSIDNSLVAWNPQNGTNIILIKDLPAPLLVLRPNPQGDKIVYIAGEKTDNQVIGMIEKIDGIWKVHKFLWAGTRITNACLQPDGDKLLLVCGDHSLAIFDYSTESIVSRIYYEQRPDTRLRGYIRDCAFGDKLANHEVVVASDKGNIAKWIWKMDKLVPCDDFKGLQESVILTLLDFVAGRNDVLLSTHLGASFAAPFGTRKTRHHSFSVTGCALTDFNKLASICRDERSLKWWTFDGLEALDTYCIEPPCSIAADTEKDNVFVGTDNGWLYYASSNSYSANRNMVPLFASKTNNVFSKSSGTAIAASSEGQIIFVDFNQDKKDWLYSIIGYYKQKGLLKHPDPLVNYISVRKNETGDQDIAITIGIGVNQEKVVYSNNILFNVAISPDGSHLAIDDKSLSVWEINGFSLNKKYGIRQNDLFAGIDFVCGNELLVVAKKIDPWLELRKCAPGLPIVAVLELPSSPTFINVRNTHIALGFSSGALLTLKILNT